MIPLCSFAVSHAMHPLVLPVEERRGSVGERGTETKGVGSQDTSTGIDGIVDEPTSARYRCVRGKETTKDRQRNATS
jgi:hypothetical protein